MTDAPPASRPRIVALDVARGIALAAMATYHLAFDAAVLGLAPERLPFLPIMRVYSHVIACTFLGLVGVSLALAHRDGFRLQAFLRRFLTIAIAAGAVTLVTLFYDPPEAITFGILHCIAAASLLGGVCLFLPVWASFALGVAVAAAPIFVSDPAFNGPAIAWLGLGTLEPRTLDWRPFMPWAGASAIALALARTPFGKGQLARLSAWAGNAPLWRGLAFAGRHSLVIYLAHQPALFGLLATLAYATGASDVRDRSAYMRACSPACMRAGGEMAACDKACACVVERAEAEGLMSKLVHATAGPEEKTRLQALVGECSVTAK